MKEPTRAPFQPPYALPNTPQVPPEKKQMPAAGIMIVLLWNATISAIAARPPRKDPINPTSTAVGANGKIAGQSTAGLEFGMYFSEIATNAAVISAMN